MGVFPLAIAEIAFTSSCLSVMVPIRQSSVENGAEDAQVPEPASSLVKTFGDEGS